MKQKLEIAQKMLALAQIIKDNSQNLDDVTNMQEFCGNVSDNKDALAKLVLEKLFSYTDVAPVAGQDGIYSAKNAEGQDVYLAAVVDGGVLKFYEAAYHETFKITSEDELENAESEIDGSKYSLWAKVDGSTTYEIVVTGNGTWLSPYEYKVKTGSYTYRDLKWDSNGAYYKKSTKKIRVNVIHAPDTEYTYSEEDFFADSATILSFLENVEDAESFYNGVSDKKDAAQADFNQAEADLNQLLKELEKLETYRDMVDQMQTSLQEKLDELNDKLYGDSIDELVRSFVSGEFKDIAGASAKLVGELLTGKIGIADISEAYGRFTSFSEAMEAFSKIGSGDLSLENIQTIAEVLGSLDIPVLTRKAITDRICELLTVVHTNAYNSIGTTMEEAKVEMKEKTENVKEKTEDLYSAVLGSFKAYVKNRW